jgi:hypothetical protein
VTAIAFASVRPQEWNWERTSELRIWRRDGQEYEPRRNHNVQVCPPPKKAWLYADRLKPALRDGMVDHITVPMVQSGERQIFADNLVPKEVYEKGIADLSRVEQIEEGTFFYTWFKVVAVKAQG